MVIDWFTVAAQVVNFFILVWLMHRFLYAPILKAIDAREERIAAELADAEAQKAEAQKDREEYQARNDAFDKDLAAKTAEATTAAQAQGERLLEAARAAADAMSASRQEALLSDARSLNQALALRTTAEVFAISRKVLSELADASLEERVSAAFTRRLGELDGPAREALLKAFGGAQGPALVRSAFDLPADQRAVIQSAVNETFSSDVSLRFETSPELVGGIELTLNGHKLGWSMGGYLATLESAVGELLRRDAGPQAHDAPDPTPAATANPPKELHGT